MKSSKKCYCIEYLVLTNDVHTRVWYEKDVLTRSEMEQIADRAEELRYQHRNSYVIVRVT